MRVGPQRGSQNPRIPAIVLRTRRREAVPEAVELLRVDRVNHEAPLHETLDHRSTRRLERHADVAGLSSRERQQPGRHRRQARTPVLERPFAAHLARRRRARTPDAVASPSRRPRTTPASRRTSRLAAANGRANDACRSLYWRSWAQTPHGASIAGAPSRHKSPPGDRITGGGWSLPTACPTPRLQPAKSLGRVQGERGAKSRPPARTLVVRRRARRAGRQRVRS